MMALAMYDWAAERCAFCPALPTSCVMFSLPSFSVSLYCVTLVHFRSPSRSSMSTSPSSLALASR